MSSGRSRHVPVLDADSVPQDHPEFAFDAEHLGIRDDLDGLIAVGGQFSTPWLQAAYRRGVFPWFIQNGKPFWFCPPVRCVLQPRQLYINRTLRKFLRHHRYRIWINRDRAGTVRNCAQHRHDDRGTWISAPYIELYPKQPNFISFEVYNENDQMAGGLYGLVTGGIFCGESQFSIESNTSKLAMTALCSWCIEHSVSFIDCQLPNEYLESMGAQQMTRAEYLGRIQKIYSVIPQPEHIFATSEYFLSREFSGRQDDSPRS